MTLDELKPALARLLPAHAAFDGWSDDALRAAAHDLGIPADRARLAFSGGAADMVQAWIATADEDMARALAAEGGVPPKIRDRIRTAIWTRFQQAARHREAVRRAVAVLGMPQNGIIATRTLWRTADAIWRAAGVSSSDFSHYTRRMTVAAVYSSSLLVWLNDESDGFSETAAFLDRRIETVMQIEKAKARWRDTRQKRPSLVRLLGRLRYPAI